MYVVLQSISRFISLYAITMCLKKKLYSVTLNQRNLFKDEIKYVAKNPGAASGTT